MKTNQAAQAAVSNNAPLGRSALGASAGQRLPVPPRERKPALAALAVLLILGGALTSAYLVIQSGERVSAIQISKPVAAGQRITPDAMGEVQIGNTGIEFINWAHRQRVAGTTADVQLVPGTLLTNAMLRQGNNQPTGRIVVGLALKAGQLPVDGVQPGARVGLYAVGGNSASGVRPGTVLSTDAVVLQVRGAGEERLRDDQTMVDVAVLPGEAPLLTQAASAGSVAIALVPPGTRVVAPPRTDPRPSAGAGGQTPAPGDGGPTEQPGG